MLHKMVLLSRLPTLPDLQVEVRPYLSKITSCSTLYQRHSCCQAKPVHMTACIQVVQAIQNNTELSEIVDVEFWVFDICMVRDNVDVRSEPQHCFTGNLVQNL